MYVETLFRFIFSSVCIKLKCSPPDEILVGISFKLIVCWGVVFQSSNHSQVYIMQSLSTRFSEKYLYILAVLLPENTLLMHEDTSQPLSLSK